MSYQPGDDTLAHIMLPIANAMNHPQVTDIVINKPFQVGIRKDGVWSFHTVPSFDLDTLDAATILIGQRNRREFDEANPYLNATMPGGQRHQGVRSPGTHFGRVLWAIRRPPAVARRVEDPDFEDLISDVNKPDIARQGKAVSVASAYKNKDWRGVLVGGRMAGMNIGICGSTGDGKSDIVRRFVQVYRPHTRMVTLETDDEVGDAGPENKAPVLYDDTKLSADEALRIAKRLVPDEIVLQEVRGAEGWTLLLALNSGHCGLTTWHANEGEELEALADMATQHHAGRALKRHELIAKCTNAFDIIAYAKRTDRKNHDSDKGFRITSIRLMAAEREVA